MFLLEKCKSAYCLAHGFLTELFFQVRDASTTGWSSFQSASMKGWSNLQSYLNQPQTAGALTSGASSKGSYGSTSNSTLKAGGRADSTEEFWSWDESIGATEQDGGVAEGNLVDVENDGHDDSWTWDEDAKKSQKSREPKRSSGMNGSAGARQTSASKHKVTQAKAEGDGWEDTDNWDNDDDWGAADAWSNEGWMSPQSTGAKPAMKTSKIGKKAD